MLAQEFANRFATLVCSSLYVGAIGKIGIRADGRPCRADLTALYLSKYPELYDVFQFNEKNKTDLQWLMYNFEITHGIQEMTVAYDVETKNWKEAHAQDRFVIMKYIYEN